MHQHLFCARLDMTVDGLANAVDEVDLSGLPVGPDNPYGNAIAQTVTRLRSEAQAARRCDAARARTWRVVSTERVNRYGRPTGYTLYPEGRRCCWPTRRRRCTRGPASPPTTCG